MCLSAHNFVQKTIFQSENQVIFSEVVICKSYPNSFISAFPITGDGPNNVNKKARNLLFSKFSFSELVQLRLVCREWKDEIGKLFSSTNHLMLFENNESQQAYVNFINKAGLNDDCRFQLKTYNSACSTFEIIVDDLKSFATNELICHFVNLEKLTFFGLTENWQSDIVAAISSLINITTIWSFVANVSCTDSVSMVAKNANLFNRMKSIHFVHPSDKDKNHWTNLSADDKFLYVTGHKLNSISADLFREPVQENHHKTRIYLYNPPV